MVGTALMLVGTVTALAVCDEDVSVETAVKLVSQRTKVPHTIQSPTQPGRAVAPYNWTYMIDIEVNGSTGLISALNNISLPVLLNNYTQISQIQITTACVPGGAGVQCHCGEGHAWPLERCLTNGACDAIARGVCTCINGVPSDGQFCQPTTVLQAAVAVEVDVELVITDLKTMEMLRSLLDNNSFPLVLSAAVEITDINITTVCYPFSAGFQCTCEDPYRWSCDKCLLYGSCDNITDETCGCINALPPDEEYCQLSNQLGSPVVYEYLATIELKTTNTTVIEKLRSILENISYPFPIDRNIQISEVNITTVCYPFSAGFQCTCEDPYRWSCDKCLLYGSCDNITDETCGCINALPPDEEYCQLSNQLVNTTCPITTSPPTSTTSPPTSTMVYEYLATIELKTTNITVIEKLRSILENISYPFPIDRNIQISEVNITTVCYPFSAGFQCTCEDPYRWSCDKCLLYGSCDNITDETCGCINALPPDEEYCQLSHQLGSPVVYEYLATIELKTTNTTVIEKLRSILENISYPFPIDGNIQISEVNITTVCYPFSAGFQCTCEDPYRWSCDKCLLYGSCDNITDETCGCINALPPDEEYCQLSHQLNGIDVDISVTLDMVFTEELNVPTSSQYTQLKNNVEAALRTNYGSLQGFISAKVQRFRRGSVIVDFVVSTTTVLAKELMSANQKLATSLAGIAPVIGNPTAISLSPDRIAFNSPVYTGQTLTLTCGPPSDKLGIGVVSNAMWYLGNNLIQNNGRFQITISSNRSKLTIKSLFTLDRGDFNCTLEGQALRFIQKGNFSKDTLLDAPVISVDKMINARCTNGGFKLRTCCVQVPYNPQWLVGLELGGLVGSGNCVQYNYMFNCSITTVTTICQVKEAPTFKESSTLNIFTTAIHCNDAVYGQGALGATSSPGCDPGLEGERSAECRASGWFPLENTCIVPKINELLEQSTSLNQDTVPTFVIQLNDLVNSAVKPQITGSSATISAIVNILSNIGTATMSITDTTMKNILETVEVIVGNDASGSWATLNANLTDNASSLFLNSMESITSSLTGVFSVTTPSILLNRTSFTNSFTANLNSSLVIDIQNTNSTDLITTITFSTLFNVLPPRNGSFNLSTTVQNANGTTVQNDTEATVQNRINAAVVLVQLNQSKQLPTATDVTLSYRKLNTSLTQDPQCVFWNFGLLDSLGGWDDEGCRVVADTDSTVTCACNHLTSFSLLMSTAIPPGVAKALDIITYIGVGISVLSLVICLIIEGLTWKAMTRNTTSFLRHVSIVNIAVSLLIADIWFLIGAAITLETDEKAQVPVDACSAATFFIHLFYLALFFWMLVSALLLFYRTVLVFSHMSKSTMLAIGFSLGYGAPLIIAVVTVAATAPQNPPGYIRRNNGCWLNWSDTYALLAFIIPAGVIVFVNVIILIVVLVKMLRRGAESSNSEEKNTLIVIFRCVAILFPTFGLTWALGVGIMVAPQNVGLHVTFALFNSLQGFFILVFGTLMDSKIRAALSRTIPNIRSSSNQTRSTSGGGVSSSGRWALFNRIRGRHEIYHVSDTANNSSSNTASESFLNI
ncbi:unnamed protein product [Lota lota]